MTLAGPRQCGKRTLARLLADSESPSHFFDLERVVDRRKLSDPELTLEPLTGLVVIDEIQHQVFAITHLPQVAGAARSHFVVEKIVEKDRTFSRLRPVSHESRIDEIARMLGGRSESARHHAMEPLEQGLA